MLARIRQWLHVGHGVAAGEQSGSAANADARFALAAEAIERNDPLQAQSLYRQIAEEAPSPEDRSAAWAELSMLLQAQDRIDEASAAMERALGYRPGDALLNYRAGVQRLHRGEAEAALDYFNLCLHYSPSFYPACFGKSNALRAIGRVAEEGEALRAFLAANPGHPDAAYALAGWHYGRGDHDAALALLRPLAAAEPPEPKAAAFLGLIVGRELGRFEESEQLLRRALAAEPASSVARCNLGWMLAERGDYEQGMRYLDELLAEDPQDHQSRLIRGYMNLKRGEFAQGWRDYGARHHSGFAIPNKFEFPHWDGSPMPGASLAILAEQGLGDQIMFASCFSEAMQRIGRCAIECNPKLVTLYQRSFPEALVFPASVEGDAGRIEGFGRPDVQVHMGDLPGFFRNAANDFPRHRGYLQPAPQRVAYWREQLARLGPGPKVGVSWRGGVAATRRHLRSMDLGELIKPFSGQAHLVNLQYGDCTVDLDHCRRATGDAPWHWPAALDDYDETAALVAALDLVVSVCTAVVHLSGALGKPVWVLTPAVAEWRYMSAGSSLPWYPSARLFRQTRAGDWTPVLGAVAEAWIARQRGVAPSPE